MYVSPAVPTDTTNHFPLAGKYRGVAFFGTGGTAEQKLERIQTNSKRGKKYRPTIKNLAYDIAQLRGSDLAKQWKYEYGFLWESLVTYPLLVEALVFLGWSAQHFTGGSAPLSNDCMWDELSKAQKQALEVLGIATKEQWE
eukprot:COSAG01_NODE_4374_length_5087_cov_2.572374_5_plen_141_part_00